MLSLLSLFFEFQNLLSNPPFTPSTLVKYAILERRANTLRVLLVDDDQKLLELLSAYFLKNGFAVLEATNGPDALELAQREAPDLIVLDLMLPGLDGWEVCRRLRKTSDVPILMLTARDEEADRLIGRERGADDYVTNPFTPGEVVARAKAILRRSRREMPAENELRQGPLVMLMEQHRVLLHGKELELTPTEYKLLETLAAKPGRVFSRLQLVEQVQGYAFEGYERTVDAHIKNLRRKLGEEQQLVQTVYGVGYKWSSEAECNAFNTGLPAWCFCLLP